MRIGIKYCGGCNPIYDRTKLVNQIMEKHPNIIFEPVNELNYYDTVLIVNGCIRSCSSHNNIKVDKKIFLNNKSDFDNLLIDK